MKKNSKPVNTINELKIFLEAVKSSNKATMYQKMKLPIRDKTYKLIIVQEKMTAPRKNRLRKFSIQI